MFWLKLTKYIKVFKKRINQPVRICQFIVNQKWGLSRKKKQGKIGI